MLLIAGLCVALAQVPPGPAPPGDGAASHDSFVRLDNGLRACAVEVPAGSGACLLLGIGVGPDHDPAGRTGLGEVVGEWLRLTQQHRQPASAWQVTVHRRATLVSVLSKDGADLDEMLARGAELLSGALPRDADLVARAVARARLAADDHTEIYPGTQLASRARRVLLRGTPGGRQGEGIDAEMRSIDRAFFERWIAAHVGPANAVVALFAPLPRDRQLDRIAATLGAVEGSAAPPPTTVHDPLPPPLDVSASVRVAGPYGAIAVRAPARSDAQWPAFVVGMHLAQRYAILQLGKARGGEANARTVPFAFAWREGAEVALWTRRGHDDDDVAVVWREIDACIDAFVQAQPRSSDVAEAAARLASTLARPPYGPERSARLRMPAAQFPLARHLVLAEIHGWPPDTADRLLAVDAASVGKIAREALAPERRQRFAVAPDPVR